MSAGKVRIDELRLRVPGLSRPQAQRLGEIVAQQLAESSLVRGEQSQFVPSLSLRIDSNTSTSVERMANEITHGIRRNLR